MTLFFGCGDRFLFLLFDSRLKTWRKKTNPIPFRETTYITTPPSTFLQIILPCNPHKLIFTKSYLIYNYPFSAHILYRIFVCWYIFVNVPLSFADIIHVSSFNPASMKKAYWLHLLFKGQQWCIKCTVNLKQNYCWCGWAHSSRNFLLLTVVKWK